MNVRIEGIMANTDDTFFKPAKLSALEKAKNTDSAAKQIISAEVAARDAKTAKLRALRLAQEDTVEPVSKPGRKTAV
jgi:hypothetical protein